jgi:hypothetical protein
MIRFTPAAAWKGLANRSQEDTSPASKKWVAPKTRVIVEVVSRGQKRPSGAVGVVRCGSGQGIALQRQGTNISRNRRGLCRIGGRGWRRLHDRWRALGRRHVNHNLA